MRSVNLHLDLDTGDLPDAVAELALRELVETLVNTVPRSALKLVHARAVTRLRNYDPEGDPPAVFARTFAGDPNASAPVFLVGGDETAVGYACGEKEARRLATKAGNASLVFSCKFRPGVGWLVDVNRNQSPVTPGVAS